MALQLGFSFLSLDKSIISKKWGFKMKKFSIVLLVCSTLLLSACSSDKKAEPTDSASKQETKVSKTKETETSTKSSSSTESSSVAASASQSASETVSPVTQEETYEQLKQRTLNSTPSDRTNWSNKEWEAFGMALSENGLAMDDSGNIVTQDQQNQLEAEKQAREQSNSESQDVSTDTNTLTGFLNVYGMTPAAYKVQNGMSIEEALRSTPNDMKTSGEIQTGYAEYGIE